MVFSIVLYGRCCVAKPKTVLVCKFDFERTRKHSTFRCHHITVAFWVGFRRLENNKKTHEKFFVGIISLVSGRTKSEESNVELA